MRTEAIDPPGIDWLRVSPKYVTVRLAGWALGNLIAVGPAVAAPGPGADRSVGVAAGSGWPSPFRPSWLLLALWRLVLIPRQVRSIGYAEREDDLLIRRGIFFQRTLVVPYGRMQYVDIARGTGRTSAWACAL